MMKPHLLLYLHKEGVIGGRLRAAGVMPSATSLAYAARTHKKMVATAAVAGMHLAGIRVVETTLGLYAFAAIWMIFTIGLPLYTGMEAAGSAATGVK